MIKVVPLIRLSRSVVAISAILVVRNRSLGVAILQARSTGVVGFAPSSIIRLAIVSCSSLDHDKGASAKKNCQIQIIYLGMVKL